MLFNDIHDAQYFELIVISSWNDICLGLTGTIALSMLLYIELPPLHPVISIII